MKFLTLVIFVDFVFLTLEFFLQITRKLVLTDFSLPSSCWVSARERRRSQVRCHGNTLRQSE